MRAFCASINRQPRPYAKQPTTEMKGKLYVINNLACTSPPYAELVTFHDEAEVAASGLGAHRHTADTVQAPDHRLPV